MRVRRGLAVTAALLLAAGLWLPPVGPSPGGAPAGSSLGEGPAAALVPAPVANLSARPTSGTVPLTVNFSGSASGSFAPYTYDWSFGDGSADATGAQVDHTYRWVAAFQANLTVTDAFGATATRSVTILVTPAPLVAFLEATPALTRVGNRTLLATNATGGTAPYRYAWAGLPPGCVPENAAELLCVPGAGGTYRVTVTVTDAEARTASANATLFVTGGSSPPPPAAGWPTWVLGAAIAAAAGAGIAGGVLLRRRRTRG